MLPGEAHLLLSHGNFAARPVPMQVRQLSNPRLVYTQLMEMLARLAGLGLVHCDYNEFNLLVCGGGRAAALSFACCFLCVWGVLLSSKLCAALRPLHPRGAPAIRDHLMRI